jgi:hypothetical protein
MREEIMRLKTTGVPRLKRMAKEKRRMKSSIFVSLQDFYKGYRNQTIEADHRQTRDKSNLPILDEPDKCVNSHQSDAERGSEKQESP